MASWKNLSRPFSSTITPSCNRALSVSCSAASEEPGTDSVPVSLIRRARRSVVDEYTLGPRIGSMVAPICV
jgi:hypothetical protein